jgi:alpha-glucoside transport system substrate-binding protein
VLSSALMALRGVGFGMSRRRAPGRSSRWASGGSLRSWSVILAVAMLGCGAPPVADEPSSDARLSDAARGSGVIRVLGSWEESELVTLREMVLPFEERTGHRVEFETTRDLRGAIESSLEAGDPPDIAGLPGPGYMAELARRGQLVDLGAAIDLGAYKRMTAPAFVHLGTIDGRLVGVFLKGTIKGLLWYRPDVFGGGPFADWARLQHAAMTSVPGVRPWCIGLASDAASGWPGTDWIEDFVLRQSGPRVYDDWVDGRIRWSAPEIRRAFETFGTVVGEQDVHGGVQGALETHFSRAGDGLFSEPPACLMVHQATFMSTFLDEAVARSGGSYDFMPFPDIDPRFAGALIGAGDLIALLRDTGPGRQLLSYLMGTQAQSILVGAGGALSGNLLLDDYPSDILRRQARLLAAAAIFRFDASDAMPEEMGRAFWQAVLDFVADQSRLEDILAELDAVQAEAYGEG